MQSSHRTCDEHHFLGGSAGRQQVVQVMNKINGFCTGIFVWEIRQQFHPIAPRTIYVLARDGV